MSYLTKAMAEERKRVIAELLIEDEGWTALQAGQVTDVGDEVFVLGVGPWMPAAPGITIGPFSAVVRRRVH